MICGASGYKILHRLAMLLLLLLFFCVRSVDMHILRANFSQHLTDAIVSQNTTLPTVDVFYYFLDDVDDELRKNRRPRYSYIVKRMFWVLPMIARKLARESVSGFDTRIHIVTNSDDIAKRAALHGYHAHDSEFYKRADQKWLPNVKASLIGTVSPFEYEITILRWIIFAEIMKKWNGKRPEAEKMTRLLVLDGDVMMTVNSAYFFQMALNVLTEQPETDASKLATRDDLGYELISFGEGVVNLFSPHGLEEYSSFIRQWFNRDEKVVVADSKSIGGIYFSDMELQRYFTHRNTSTRVNYLALENATTLNHFLRCSPSNSVEGLHSRHNSHFCVGNEVLDFNWLEKLQGSSSSSTRLDVGIRIGGDAYPQCFIHFQGMKNKPLLYLYGRAFENLINVFNERNLKPFDLEPMQPDLLFQPAGSRSIYFVNSTLGRKQHISSMDTFAKYNLSIADVLYRVPVWITDMFPAMIFSLE